MHGSSPEHTPTMPMPRVLQPTLKDIAAATRVSVRVIAAVLAGGSGTIRFSNATRRRVLAAAQRLGYQPNRTARWLRQGRHGSIGVVARSEYVISPQLLDGMLRATRARGLFLVQDRTPAGEMPMFLDTHCVDGLICFSDLSAACVARINALRLPVLWVNTNRRRGANVVTYDERGAARLAVEHMRARGWRHPFIVGGMRGHYSMADRCAGMRDCLRNAPVFSTALPPWERGKTFERTVAALSRFLRRHPRANAALTCGALYLPALYEALRRLGKRVGEDVGVVTFGRWSGSDMVAPNATALDLDEPALGVRIIAMMEALIQGDTPRATPYVAGYALVVRESTAGTQSHGTWTTEPAHP